MHTSCLSCQNHKLFMILLEKKQKTKIKIKKKKGEK